MTIQVTIKVDFNPPGTCVEVARREADKLFPLCKLGAGESHTANIWEGCDIVLCESLEPEAAQ